ncbi:3-alpha-hydroxysteroid dehydrogenase [Arthrobacter sp. MYb229]|uniref:SDR family oxidoreductase n=1 Tax=Micrococcaceae TaxID=1268 RepID=UPI000CFBC3D8|nr:MULTISPECIES: SDR family oxidoreductase [unclassified Arthrobacter]PRA04395.1 3-alpha-hydroxysteroid dehydrogenase [Arthrobacter sp. MYb229]PRB51691.1 3-alpha-hydroxysteroid dehydrogenase [Arthrobacter sp. MYb216]
MAKQHRQSTPGRLAGKVILISGAASGMGAEHARSICHEGGRVVIGDIAHEAGRALAEELNDAHGETVARYAELDVTVFDDWLRAVEGARVHFGALHGLVNNAGIGSRGSVEEATLEDWKRTIDINLTGNFYGMKAAVPALKEHATSSIVNVSSIAGLTGFKNRASYSASKWGVQGLTKTSALDLGDMGIRVNSIHPGSVNTPMTAGLKRGFGQIPVGRAAETNEVSPLVIYLLSDESRFVSGASISIDGGETAGNNLRPFN